MTDSAVMPQTSNTQEELPEIPHVFYQGVPVFFATDKDIKASIAKKYNYSAYYLLGNDSYYDEKTKKTESGKVTLFLVTNNVVGSSTQPVYNAGFAVVPQSSNYTLPKIPQKMVATIDAFFRRVYEAHGTEAIVILTYDTSKEGSSGWGWVVPTQTNTAVHCNYDPQSLVGLFPNDTTYQVGTAHSHPGMDAYKSGTDHADQMKAGDGLHVTFGWKNSKMGGATEYYAEIQFSQMTTTVNFQSLVESYAGDVDTSAIDAAFTKVTKETYTPVVTEYGMHNYAGNFNTGTNKYGYGNNYVSSAISKKRLTYLPADSPDPTKSVILIPTFIDATSKKHNCSGCGTELLPAELEKRQCLICKMPLYTNANETLEDIIAIKKEAKTSYTDIDIHSAHPIKPIFQWIRTGNVDEFKLLHNPDANNAGK